MVQIKPSNFWSSDCSNLPISRTDITKIEQSIHARLPKLYVSLMSIHDGGWVVKDCFSYFDRYKNRCEKGNIGIMYSLIKGEESVLQDFVEPPEFFPEGLVSFADDGGGNLVCFDYRENKSDPPVVFWVCGDSIGEDTHFLAKNFEGFVDMLYSDDASMR